MFHANSLAPIVLLWSNITNLEDIRLVMRTLAHKIYQKKELIILAMMLEMLHLAIWFDFGSTISRSLMLSHLGLFILWQPVWRGDEKLGIDNMLLFVVFTLLLSWLLNLWLLFAWLVLLIGFISGRVTINQSERAVYSIAIGFLVLQLLFACVPEIASIDIEQKKLLIISLSILPVFILFFPSNKPSPNLQMVDFIHAITTSMFTSLVAMGILLNMFLSNTSYFIALAQTSVAIGSFIICISWLLSTQTRFVNVVQLWGNYMLNIGTPFEEWLSQLASLNEEELTPDDFLISALQKMVNFSWISGIHYEINSEKNDIGIETKNRIDINNQYIVISIYTYTKAGTALYIHCNLLIKLLTNFYQNKQHEQELTRQAHLQAIYETGARITHDIKNLLQSLQAITSIIANDSDNSNLLVSQQVLKKQLPNLTQRLQMALDKLQTPEKIDTKEIYLTDWWQDLQKRNEHNPITFQNNMKSNPTIPVDLFDSVVENLLENIQCKQMNETDITITITLVCDTNIVNIMVCDSGSKIDDNIAKDLLKKAIASNNGLGIGLYQANKHAELFGYRLNLVDNQTGRVCFELSNEKTKASVLP